MSTRIGSWLLTPKGSDSIAQGNVLGLGVARSCTLKGCDGERLSQSFRLQIPVARSPRALPWAMLSDPFGVNSQGQKTR